MDYICKQLKSPALLSKTLTKKANDKQLSDLGPKNNSKEQSDTRNNLGKCLQSFWSVDFLALSLRSDGFIINL